MIQKILQYYHTLKHMRWIQIRYQIWYKGRSIWRKSLWGKPNLSKKPRNFVRVTMKSSIYNNTSYFKKNTFLFLNIKHDFGEKINWDYQEYGKLWTYNLNYFEFLNQANSSRHVKEFNLLVWEYVNKLPAIKVGNEPFPTSLRIMNWIKFIIRYEINDPDIIDSLYNQCWHLSENKEYHLMGNHLLENGFSLTMAGIFFQDKKLFLGGKKVLHEELEEQILTDGAHFELSPMYHCLIFYRLLDTINIVKNNLKIINHAFGDQESFLKFLISKAELMGGWLKQMMYAGGSYPHFNDSTDDVAPGGNELILYLHNLDIQEKEIILSASGYRRYKHGFFDTIIKAGNIGPDYIPGHAHADSLSFVCNIDGHPVIVDPGVSTYEKNNRRQSERSTSYHNTLTILDLNSSDVWGGFRVGRRAKAWIIEENDISLVCQHDGFKTKHKRNLKFGDTYLIISDEIKSNDAFAHFHFYPGLQIQTSKTSNIFTIQGNTTITFENADEIKIESYRFARGFNATLSAQKITIKFAYHLKTTIKKL